MYLIVSYGLSGIIISEHIANVLNKKYLFFNQELILERIVMIIFYFMCLTF